MNNNQLNIFYVADFGCPSGYSRAARDYVFALDKIGINVIPVFPPSTWDGKYIDEEDFKRLQEMAKRKPNSKYQVAIEQMVPELMSDRRNIAFCVWETSHAPKHWADILNKKLAVFTCSIASRDALLRSGVKIPVFVVPHVVEPKITKSELNMVGKLEKNFLVVGEYSERKAIEETIVAFLIATNGRKDTSLTLKCSSFNPTKTGMKIKQMVTRAIETSKKLLGDSFISTSPVLLCDKIMQDQFMSEFYMNSTHFITASKGEAFNLPLAEAMFYGLTTLAPKEGGHRVFCDETNSVLMEGSFVKAGGVDGNSRYDDAGAWYEISLDTLISAISYTLDNDTTKEADQGKKAIRTLLNPVKIAQLYANLIKQILNPTQIIAGPPELPAEKPGKPFVVKCVQALNEEQLIKPALRNCYNEVDLLLVVEGGALGRHDAQNGHSIDNTHKEIMDFIEKEDTQKKTIYFTKHFGFKDYEDIKNVFAEFINKSLSHINNKICYISDADEFMFPEQLKECIEEFVKDPTLNEVVPKFIHFWRYIDVIERPIPSKMNIQHQRLTRWPEAGGWFFNHPTLTDLSNGQDTACAPMYQERRKVVDKYIYHVGGMKSLDFYRKKHEYYNKALNGHLNPDMNWKAKGDMPKERFLSYNNALPEEIIGFCLSLKWDKIPTNVFPDWKSSNAYNGAINTVPLFTAMEDAPFTLKEVVNEKG